jgi:succinoglycan biosynthesis transport protein ExoP
MEPHDFLDIFSRKIGLIVFTILLALFGASIYCVLATDQYKSSTKILVIPPRVSEALVRSTMNYSVQERLATIREQVLSRTRMIEVIDELSLFREERESTPPELLVEKFMERIEIDVVKGKDAFALSFVHEDPMTAKLTATKLASFFIEQNIKAREQESVETAAFLDSQLEKTKAKLEEQEEKIKRYKLEYLGELPQQMEANLSMLSRLQDQEKSYAEALMRAEDRKVFLESEINKLQRQGPGAKDPTDSLIDALGEKQKQLQDLSARYTDDYPTIIQLRREIEQLEAQILTIQGGDTTRAGEKIEAANKGKASIRRIKGESSEMSRLRTQVDALNLEIAALRREKEQNRIRISTIETKVGRLPQREQELVSLTRDYENLKRSYDDLLNKKLQAGISRSLEEREKSERFQILDPANLPSIPFKPDRMKVMGLAFLGSLVFVFGGVLGLEILDPTLRDTKEFKYFYDIPILAAIPVIRDEAYIRKQKFRKKALLAGIFSFASAVAVFLIFYQDKIRLILNISGGSG